jgi:hypothetical protein
MSATHVPLKCLIFTLSSFCRVFVDFSKQLNVQRVITGML